MTFNNRQIAALDINEDYDKLLEDHFSNEHKEGKIVRGVIVDIDNDCVTVDVGLKSEGRVPLKELAIAGGSNNVNIGDEIDVYIEKFEGKKGLTVLSRERAIRNQSWEAFERFFADDVAIDGSIVGRVKGGFAVDIGGLIAFLPGSQVDIRPAKNASVLAGAIQPFKILKMDKAHGNIVVSRRAIMEESRKEARDELLSNIKEGMVLKGAVKNLTDYGAFIDLQSTDGLLHITDISWSKISHPSEVLTIGQTVEVMVIKYNQETRRISLGLKQLAHNPWEDLAQKYSQGSKHKGKVVAITDYGAFVNLENNVDGLVYHTELHWTARNVHPSKMVEIGQEVEVVVLDFDVSRHRISLSLKRCQPNIWKEFVEKHPVGSQLDVVVRNVSEFGLFVASLEDKDDEHALNLLIPAHELSWEKSPEASLKDYSKGDQIRCLILNADPDRERITGSVRQTVEDKIASVAAKLSANPVAKGKVLSMKREGLEIEVEEGVIALIEKSELARHKDEDVAQNFAQGDMIEFKFISFDAENRKLKLSVRALQKEQEDALMSAYNADAPASNFRLSNIIDDALGGDQEDKDA